MVTERTIINALIIGATFILVPFVISSSLTVDYLPLLCFVALLALLLAFFFLKDTLCVWPLLTTGIGWNLNFLPLPLSLYHVLCMLLILYYFTGYVIIRQRAIKLGKTQFLWPILIVTSVLLYHNHSLNLRVMGGDTEGAKPAILMYLIVIAYFCGINVATPSTRFLSRIPLYFVIVSGLGCIPYLLTTYVPSLAPAIYHVISGVNVEAYLDTQATANVGEVGLSRLTAFGPLGSAIQIYLLCYYPIGTWVRPDRWWVAGLSLICAVLAVSSGYRSALVGFAALTMIGAWCYHSWRSLFLPAGIVIVALLFVVASNNNLIRLPENKLPMIMQRSLSFLPGDWSEEAIESGQSSNDFRKNIRNVYIQEYLAKSPLIGNGFSINKKLFDNLIGAVEQGGGGGAEYNGYRQAKAFIEGKMFHIGWISVYDCVGIIGSLGFLALGVNVMWVAGRVIFGPKSNRRSSFFPVYAWVLCNVGTSMFTFLTVFGDFKETFMSWCLYAILLSQLSDVEKTGGGVPVPLRERKGQGDFVGSKGVLYGYQSRP